MTEQRDYQHGFSNLIPSMYDKDGRTRKAQTMVAVLKDHFDAPLNTLDVLDVGASTGIIDDHLAMFFRSVTGIDIDADAISSAATSFNKQNLQFRLGDAMKTGIAENSVDVVICSQIYEHVPDASRMIDEIYRVLRPGGVCYFAASNRFMWNEPHYNLPLLSAIPRSLAHRYIRIAGKANRYHELHLSYWGLRKLTRRFDVVDYTRQIISNPEHFKATYMLPPGSLKTSIAQFIARYAYWLVPGYIWLLRKP